MNGTKGEILALLKRNGGHTVRDMAGALELSPVTIRQHLTHLQRDGLLAASKQNGNGHSQYVFRLTAKAHAAAFPRRSDRLVELVVREVALLDASELSGRDPRQRVGLILQRLAQRLADEYRPLLQGWPLQERISFVTEVMHADGGFAEWEETASGFEIRDFNCLFHRLLNGDGAEDSCEWHQGFLSLALGADVEVSPCPESTPECCRFLIRALSPAAAKR